MEVVNFQWSCKRYKMATCNLTIGQAHCGIHPPSNWQYTSPPHQLMAPPSKRSHLQKILRKAVNFKWSPKRIPKSKWSSVRTKECDELLKKLQQLSQVKLELCERTKECDELLVGLKEMTEVKMVLYEKTKERVELMEKHCKRSMSQIETELCGRTKELASRTKLPRSVMNCWWD